MDGFVKLIVKKKRTVLLVQNQLYKILYTVVVNGLLNSIAFSCVNYSFEHVEANLTLHQKYI